MNIDLEKDIVQSLSSLYPLQEFEERAIDTVLNAIPHWIPVTERLPKVKQRVIVQYADGSMAIKRCIDAGHLQWFYTKFGTVAWMPAPEPYKEVTT